LPPGKHKLSVLARSKDDTPNVSDTIEVISPQEEKDRPALHHVAVGVSNYITVRPNLRRAHEDAGRLADALVAAAKAGAAYRPGKITPLVEKNATKAKVLAELAAVRKSAPRPDDLLVFSFAGHGIREGGEFFLLTHDTNPANLKTLKETAISGQDLREAL